MTPFRPDTTLPPPRFSPQDGLTPERPAMTPPTPSRPDTALAPLRFSPQDVLTPEGPR